MEAKKSKVMRKVLANKTSSYELLEAIRRSALDPSKAYTIEVDGKTYVVKRERQSRPHKVTNKLQDQKPA